ncbi:MAG: paraquat-inducible protein A [Litoreibacter sp.]
MVDMEISETSTAVISARSYGVVGCQRCMHVSPLGTEECERCGAKLASRDHMSLQRVWAWWVVGLLCYIPANLYPMLYSRTLFSERSDTIMGGVVDLVHHGSYGIALVVFVASIIIPIGKFIAIAYLAISVQRRSAVAMNGRMGIYEIVEYIGRWSMIDVFVVAILSALVQLNAVAEISPGPASLFFAMSVVFTMLSAQSFDPRMIWDLNPALAEES